MSSKSSVDNYRVALVAHDARKPALEEWVGMNLAAFESAEIYSTGTTGAGLKRAFSSLNISALKSGPLGGDQQIGAMICENALDALIFFVDPMSPMPHDVDVKALTRLATVYDLPMASSAATATLIADAMLRRSL
ncbi:MAG: methylglyoxal synthase [Roseobacter sp.]